MHRGFAARNQNRLLSPTGMPQTRRSALAPVSARSTSAWMSIKSPSRSPTGATSAWRRGRLPRHHRAPGRVTIDKLLRHADQSQGPTPRSSSTTAGPCGSWLSRCPDRTQAPSAGSSPPPGCPQRRATGSQPTGGTPGHWARLQALRGPHPRVCARRRRGRQPRPEPGAGQRPCGLCRRPQWRRNSLRAAARYPLDRAGPRESRPTCAGSVRWSVPHPRRPWSSRQTARPAPHRPHRWPRLDTRTPRAGATPGASRRWSRPARPRRGVPCTVAVTTVADTAAT